MMTEDDLGGDPPCGAHLFDGAPGDRSPALPMPVVVDLGGLDVAGADGAVWSLPHGGDLDANLVRLQPGGEIAAHVNAEVDVVLVVQCGSGELGIDGHRRPLRSDVLALIPRGARRAISAGAQGITYLSIHRRRDRLTITKPPLPSSSQALPSLSASQAAE